MRYQYTSEARRKDVQRCVNSERVDLFTPTKTENVRLLKLFQELLIASPFMTVTEYTLHNVRCLSNTFAAFFCHFLPILCMYIYIF